MTHGHGWPIRLTTTADSDLRNILRWTVRQFGHAQARIYGETSTHAIQALTDGSHIAGSRRRDGIAQGQTTLHVARGGRKGRHFVLCRVSESAEAPTTEVLRRLHDSMGLVRHVRSATDDSPPG